MKSSTTRTLGIIVAAIALPFSAYSASETPANGQAAGTESSAAQQNTQKLRHSHMAEKIGTSAEQATQSESGDKAASKDKAAAKDKAALKRHNHQRDMK